MFETPTIAELELPLQEFFDTLTVAALATMIAQKQLKTVTDEVLEQIVTEVEQLSEKEVQRLLAETDE